MGEEPYPAAWRSNECDATRASWPLCSTTTPSEMSHRADCGAIIDPASGRFQNPFGWLPSGRNRLGTGVSQGESDRAAHRLVQQPISLDPG